MMTRLSLCHHVTPMCKAHQRGSVMLLTVVSLLMLSILGMAYLQTARLDRVAASTSSKNYIDVVANASIAYIGQVLRNDLITNDGAILDRTSGIEAYDYPWTNDNVSYTVQYNDGSTATAKGGQYDDSWLASTEPDVSSHKATWPHITNLNGTFLRIPSSSSNMSTPEELAVDNHNINRNNTWWNDTGVPVNVRNKVSNLDYPYGGYEKVGADADGDGIEDSKWTWAPIRQVSGVSYVMAARIVDNSALLNMNVALSQVSNTNSYDSVNTPMWLSPSELDFGNFAFAMGASSIEIKNLLAYRLGVTPASSLTLPIEQSITQFDFWTNGALSYDNYSTTYQKLGILNELELRYRNGLNNANITANIESSSTGMYTFLRASTTNETSYQTSYGTQMDNYFDNEPRHQLTTVSGAGIFRAALPNETPGIYKKADLSTLLTADYSSTIPNNQTYYSNSMRQKLYDFYINTGYSGDAASLSRQLTVNFVDYVDSDNKISQYFEYDASGNALGYSGEVTGTTAVYGMESLPFITEVYTQRSCKLTVSEENYEYERYGHPHTGTQKVVKANANENYKPGFAIEIRNPYRNAISLENVYLWIGNDSSASYELDLDAIAGSQLTGRVLKPSQILVLYFNSSDNSGISSSNHTITSLVSSSTSDNSVVKVQLTDVSGMPTALSDILFVDSESDKNSNFSVQLRATRQDGARLNWGYCKIPVRQYVKNPASVVIDTEQDNNDAELLDRYDADDNIKNTIQFTQTSSYANAQGLNALAYAASEWQSRERDVFNSQTMYAGYLGYMNTLERLGQDDKTNRERQGFTYPWGRFSFTYYDWVDGFTGEKLDPDSFSWSFSNLNVVEHVGDLLVVPVVGMQSDTEFATTLAVTTSSDSLRSNYMLNGFSSDNITADSSNTYYGMNFAQALLEQFVARSPASDGKDNDGDGLTDSQDTDEQFVPGTINLNTATTRLLNQILPITDTSTRDNVIASIESLRGTPDDTSIVPGIPTLSDLYNMSPSQWTSSKYYNNKTEVLRQLSSVASTRSDIYTAYVIIRGYPSGDFRKGPIESRQFFVIYDRSKITSSSDRATILGYYEFD